MAATARILFASPLVKVSDHTCDTPRSGCGCELCDPVSSVTVIRRGVHAHHARGQVALAEAGRAILYRGGESYRLSHPYDRDRTDRSTCLEFGPALLDEAFGAKPLARDLGTPLRPDTLLLTFAVTAALGAEGSDALASEERALALLHAIARDLGLSAADRGAAEPARRRVDRARGFIAADPSAAPGIEAVAAAAACSPFHLARLFRRHTGMTIRGYRLRLRLAEALQDLADGAPDLASVAVRAGFSDHSHMTAAFRKVLGHPPSSLRDALGTRDLRQMSTFFKAAAQRRS